MNETIQQSATNMAKQIKKHKKPMCLLSNIYKQLSKMTTKLEKKLDGNQPREQAGSGRRGDRSNHAIYQEKCREYNISLCVAFEDYQKKFDQTKAILISLQTQGIEDVYI